MTLAAPIEYTDAAQMLADYAERRKRLYASSPNVVRLPVVERAPALPAPVAQPTAPEEGPSDIPEFLGLRPRLPEWLTGAPAAALKPADSTIILDLVASHFKVRKMELVGPCRTADLMQARMITYWLMRRFTKLSLPIIGKRLGDRDHTTVLNGVRKIDRLRAADPAVAELTDKLGRIVEFRLGELDRCAP